MIYGGDKAIELPVKDLYDTSMMIASINAAKDLYDLGVTLIKDFSKTYGDFYSPIGKDVDYWYKNTTGKVKDVINYLYQNDIDPTRSAEGRAMIALTINLAPAAELAKMRQSSDNAKLYQKAKAELIAKGLYSLDLEDFDSGGADLANWDTEKNGTWDRLSPIAYLTLQQFTEPVFSNMGEHDLTPALAKEIYGAEYDPRYKYKGISLEDAQKAIGPSYQASVAGNPYYRFYKELARKHLIASGVDPDSITDEMVGNQFAKEAIDANWKHLNKHESAIDPIWQMNTQHKWLVEADALKEKNANYRTLLLLRAEHPEAFNEDGSMKSAKEIAASKSNGTLSLGSIFVDLLINSVATNSGKYLTRNAKFIAKKQLENIDNRINQLRTALNNPNAKFIQAHRKPYEDELNRLLKYRPGWVRATKDAYGLLDKYGNPTGLLTTTYSDLYRKGMVGNTQLAAVDSDINNTSTELKGETGSLWNKYFAPAQNSATFGGKDVGSYTFGQNGILLAQQGFLKLHGKSYTSGSRISNFLKYLNENNVQCYITPSRKTRLSLTGRGREAKFTAYESVVIPKTVVDSYILKVYGKAPKDSDYNDTVAKFMKDTGLSKTKYGNEEGFRARISYLQSLDDIASIAVSNGQFLKDLSSSDVAKQETPTSLYYAQQYAGY